jgi:hypothetical protein
MRCAQPFYDPDGGNGSLRRVNDLFDIREEFVREIVAQKLAEPVEA